MEPADLLPLMALCNDCMVGIFLALGFRVLKDLRDVQDNKVLTRLFMTYQNSHILNFTCPKFKIPRVIPT